MPGDCLLFWLIHYSLLLGLLMVEGVKVLILFMKVCSRVLVLQRPLHVSITLKARINKRLEVGTDIHTIVALLFPTCPVLSALKLQVHLALIST